jgi:hypothetical protein
MRGLEPSGFGIHVHPADRVLRLGYRSWQWRWRLQVTVFLYEGSLQVYRRKHH